MRLFFWGVLCILKQVWLLSENYFEMGINKIFIVHCNPLSGTDNEPSLFFD